MIDILLAWSQLTPRSLLGRRWEGPAWRRGRGGQVRARRVTGISGACARAHSSVRCGPRSSPKLGSGLIALFLFYTGTLIIPGFYTTEAHNDMTSPTLSPLATAPPLPASPPPSVGDGSGSDSLIDFEFEGGDEVGLGVGLADTSVELEDEHGSRNECKTQVGREGVDLMEDGEGPNLALEQQANGGVQIDSVDDQFEQGKDTTVRLDSYHSLP